MSNYLVTQCLISLVFVAVMFSLKDTPPRLQFYLAILALIAWLIPVHLVEVSLPAMAPLPYDLVLSISEKVETVWLNSVVTSEATQESAKWSLSWIWVVLMFGACWFIWDIVRHWRITRRLKRALSGYSESERDSGKPVRINWVSGLSGAMVSGVIRPTIWVGTQYRDHPAFESLIQHEVTHIQQWDHMWTWVIAFLRRLIWWSPFSWFFARYADQFMERSCDLRCAETIGRQRYQSHLAQLIMHSSLGPGVGFTGMVANHENLNVSRLRYLERKSHMKKRHILILCLAALGCVALVARPSAISDSGAQQSAKDSKEEVARVGTAGTVPPKFTHKVKPDYPSKGLAERLQGYVIVEAVLRKDGTMSDMVVLRELGGGELGFEEASLAALEQWKFEPGQVDGKPADVRMTIKIDFTLDGGAKSLQIVEVEGQDSVSDTVAPKLIEVTKPSRLKGLQTEKLPVSFWVNQWGEVEDVSFDMLVDRVVTSELPAIREAIQLAKYRPATVEGKNVKVKVQMWVPLPVDVSVAESVLARQNVPESWVVPRVEIERMPLAQLVKEVTKPLGLRIEIEEELGDVERTYTFTNIPFASLMNIVTSDNDSTWMVIDQTLFIGHEKDLLKRLTKPIE